MKSTGMVRRIDDKGRIVIPKELRRTMKIHVGDPLEYYVDKSTDSIIIKRYMPIGEKDWHKAKMVLVHILDEPFAIYDLYEKQVQNSGTFPKIPFNECEGKYFHFVSKIKCDGDTVGWLVTTNNNPLVQKGLRVLTAMFEEA